MTNMVEVPVATNVTAKLSPEGSHLALLFQTKAGDDIAIGLGERELSKTAAFLIQNAEQAAAKHETDVSPQELTVLPISIVGMNISRGRSESEALVSMKLGILVLTFAIDLPTLRAECEHLIATTRETETPPKSH